MRNLPSLPFKTKQIKSFPLSSFLPFHLDCSLALKAAHSGWFDSNSIPAYSKNCTFRFATSATTGVIEQAQGLLVKILRLNMPCSGGFLRFNEMITMCGKLEELPENRRTLYFHSFVNTTLSVYNYPKFKFIYKLVDHCYNVTFLERNSTFAIAPTNSALKCHFKIHLPFGNQIKLKIRLAGGAGKSVVSDQNVLYQKINQSMGKFNYSDLEPNEFALSSDTPTPSEPQECAGLLIETINHFNENWSQCIAHSEALENKAFELTSSDNVLLIRITKQPRKTSQDKQNNEESWDPTISLEYSAVPIETIVSQCAFGWVLVGPFCLSTFTELMPWQGAENYCNALGGHLASIQSENEQKLINEMLLNR